MTFLLVALLWQGPPAPAAPPDPPSPVQTPAAPPADPAPPPEQDPAAVTFTSDVGLLLVTVKATATEDYEAAITALQAALAAAEDEDHRALAKGWKVFKAAEPDAKGNAVYVHLLQPVAPAADYRPSILLDTILEDAPAELLAKYRDAIAGAPSKLSLEEIAHMAVAPVAKPKPPQN